MPPEADAPPFPGCRSRGCALAFVVLGALLCLATLAMQRACARGPSATRTLEVEATAFNSLRGQGQGDPTQGAWGDRLRPGMRAIAVSRDLLDEGLARGSLVRIEQLDTGEFLDGEYEVLDLMNRRHRRKIDIYYGTDRQAALRWGRRPVRIHWEPKAILRTSDSRPDA